MQPQATLSNPKRFQATSVQFLSLVHTVVTNGRDLRAEKWPVGAIEGCQELKNGQKRPKKVLF